MDKTERRAGSLLAQDVKEAGAQIRAELQKDIDAAGMKAAYLVYKVDQAHKRVALGVFDALSIGDVQWGRS